jgi:hypothetical protein
LNLESGGIYVGEFKDGVFDGYGTYTFSSASVSGLNNSWQPNPPTLTGTQANMWYCSWTAVKATTEATSASMIFGPVFQGTQFDGLVTFTAIKGALSSTSNTDITTIHGGKIQTGTIVVNKLQSGKESISGASNFSFGLGTNSVMKDGTNDLPLAAAVIGEASGTGSTGTNGNHGVLGHSVDAVGVVASTFSQNGHGAVQAYCSKTSHLTGKQTSCHLATNAWAIAGEGNGYVSGSFRARGRTVVTEVSFSGGVLSLKGSDQA